MDAALAGALIGAVAGVGGSLAGGFVSVRVAAHARRAQREQWLLDQRLSAYRNVISAIEATVGDKSTPTKVAATAKLSLLESLSDEDVRKASRELRRRLGGSPASPVETEGEDRTPAKPLSAYVGELNNAMNRQFLA